jgi:hypothetical protein
MMSKRSGEITHHDTGLGIWEEGVNEKEFMSVVQGPLIRYFRTRGFSIHRDPDTKKHYRTISDRHHRGKKGNLELQIKVCGRHIEITFFQSIVFKNQNGGQYDFHKYDKMPYLIKKQWLKEASAVLDYLVTTHGYTYGKGLTGHSPTDLLVSLAGIHPTKEPLKRFNEMWGEKRFKRDETGWPVQAELSHYYNVDREGIPLSTGMFRWWRDRKGYLRRGTIYTNMNSMWQLVYGPGRGDTTWMSAMDLFTLQPEDVRRRWFPPDKIRDALEKEKDKAVKEERFEKAAIIRDLLKAV